MPSNEFKELTLEEIKAKIGSQPKVIPETVLDYAAMHSAIDRFQLERKQTELREWLIYSAPPGVYEMFIEERKKLLALQKKRETHDKRFAFTFLLIFVGYMGWNFYELFKVGYPR